MINKNYYTSKKKKHKIIIIHKISGTIAFITFLLIIGKAGASDLGAAWGKIFSSIIYYLIIFIISSLIWIKTEK